MIQTYKTGDIVLCNPGNNDTFEALVIDYDAIGNMYKLEYWYDEHFWMEEDKIICKIAERNTPSNVYQHAWNMFDGCNEDYFDDEHGN